MVSKESFAANKVFITNANYYCLAWQQLEEHFRQCIDEVRLCSQYMMSSSFVRTSLRRSAYVQDLGVDTSGVATHAAAIEDGELIVAVE